MTRGKKLPPDQAWDALQRMALEDNAERVAKLSDDELDRELASKGVDPKALRARGAALAERLRASGREPPAKPSEQAPRRELRGWAALLAAASFAAGAVTVGIPAVVIPLARPDLAPRASPPPTSLQDQAASLRRFASDACGRQRWGDCLKALDAAKLIDPEGENSTLVRQQRSAIEEGLAAPRP